MVAERLGRTLTPNLPADTSAWLHKDAIQDLYNRAWEFGSIERGVAQAQQWAKDDQGVPFRFSADDLAKDANELRSLLDMKYPCTYCSI